MSNSNNLNFLFYKKYYALLIVDLLLLWAAYAAITREPRYRWSPGISAPAHYPAAYLNVGLDYEDGGGTGASSVLGAIDPGWGYPFGAFAVGDPFKPVPVRVTAKWLSVPEAVYYEGSFELPKKKMDSFFRSQHYDNFFKKYIKYNGIRVGAAPGGIVVVWMVSAGLQTEIGRFQAKKIDYKTPGLKEKGYTMESLSEEFLGPENRKYIDSFGIPYEIWKKPPPVYDWKPSVAYPPNYPIGEPSAQFNLIDGGIAGWWTSYVYTDDWYQPINSDNEIKKIRPLPINVSCRYYSPMEDIFYGVENKPLPFDYITKLFEERYQHPTIQDSLTAYKRIKIGCAPGGKMTIWAEGPGRLRQIKKIQADTLEITLEELVVALNKRPRARQWNKESYRRYIIGKDSTYIQHCGLQLENW